MPVYEYECEAHGVFDLIRPMSRCGTPGECPVCGRASARIVSMPSLQVMTPLGRNAAARNEKSRHEPHVCTSSCGHAHPRKAKQSTGEKSADGKPAKFHSYRGPRPWVVEHA